MYIIMILSILLLKIQQLFDATIIDIKMLSDAISDEIFFMPPHLSSL